MAAAAGGSLLSKISSHLGKNKLAYGLGATGLGAAGLYAASKDSKTKDKDKDDDKDSTKKSLTTPGTNVIA